MEHLRKNYPHIRHKASKSISPQGASKLFERLTENINADLLDEYRRAAAVGDFEPTEILFH